MRGCRKTPKRCLRWFNNSGLFPVQCGLPAGRLKRRVSRKGAETQRSEKGLASANRIFEQQSATLRGPGVLGEMKVGTLEEYSADTAVDPR